MKWLWSLLLLFCAPAIAGENILSWTLPILNDDGSELTDLAGVRIYLRVHDTEDPTVTSWTHTGLELGDYTYVATAYNSEDIESVFSNEAHKVLEGLTADVGDIAYQVVSISSGFWLLPVGTISASTPCISDQSVNGKHAVPVSAVEWSPGTTARPVVVVSDCE